MQLKIINYPIACTKYYIDNKRVTPEEFSRDFFGKDIANCNVKARECNNGMIYEHHMTATQPERTLSYAY